MEKAAGGGVRDEVKERKKLRKRRKLYKTTHTFWGAIMTQHVKWEACKAENWEDQTGKKKQRGGVHEPWCENTYGQTKSRPTHSGIATLVLLNFGGKKGEKRLICAVLLI